MNERIQKLRELGQSLWYDNLRRGLLLNGEMEALIREGTVTGITSNPTIFEKAISQSGDYDRVFAYLVAKGQTPDGIYLGLVEEDIRMAADLLRPVYDATQAVDGFVSLEVSPALAHDTAGTVQEAMKLVALLDRPNAMIKVPGTREGIPAIQELTRLGVSVNVTLLFSISSYDAAARAYIAGLEERIGAGEPVHHIASVASFFVSRVDTLVDRRLAKEQPDLEDDLRGMAAISNARIAYAHAQALYSGPVWDRLLRKGARPQRLLWASTGTKDPRYPDTMYVDALIGPNTVNTVPPATLAAFMERGRPRASLTQGLEAARQHVQQLGEAGIDLEEVGKTLQTEGVAAFAASIQALMKVIAERRSQLTR